MQTRRQSIKFLTLLLLTQGQFTQATDQQAAASDQPWETLFDGKNLDAWSKNEQEANWEITADGELHPTKATGTLLTSKRYCDFVLEMDFKMGGKAKANSGVFIHVHDPKQPELTGMEIQILDNADYGVPFNAMNANGAFYDLLPPAMDANKPIGEWNHYRITINGQLMVVELNEKEIIRADLALWKEPGKNPNGGHNKFPYAYGLMPHEGFIGLQNYNATPVWFKNIKVKALTDRKPQYTGQEPVEQVLAKP